MTTLITGGTGKTGLILAKLLTKAGQPVLLTSRKGVAPAPFRAVKFDWYDQSTFAAPFDVKAEVADDAGPAGLTLAIDRIYIIAPDTLHPGPIAKPFIDLAIVNGVKRFVLLGGTHQSSGSLDTGEVQQLLEESGAEYAVLKATWFQENFGTAFVDSIRDNDEISSSMGDGLAPFVSTRDIAQAAFDCLTVEKLGQQEILVLGPELLSYDDAVKTLSSVLGRQITHKRISPEQATSNLIGAGLPEDLASFIVFLEQGTAEGKDKKFFENDDPKKIIGKHSLLEYFKENWELWVKV